eukprot:2617457-Pyramimonas_sp.AAC.1
MALWGSSVAGIAPTRMAGLRISAASSLGRISRGASVGLRMYTCDLGPNIDPLAAYVGHVMFMWATAVWESVPNAQVLANTMQYSRAKLSKVDHPWRSCASPSDVALLSLRGIGWDFEDSTHIVSDLGV